MLWNTNGRCCKCGKRKSSRLPEGVTADTFGPKVKSTIAALSGFYKNSKREVANIIKIFSTWTSVLVACQIARLELQKNAKKHMSKSSKK